MRGTMLRMCICLACLGSSSLGACVTHTGPSEGVTLYQHPDFDGGSATFAADVWNLLPLNGPCGGSAEDYGDWDECASSIRVSPGWRATLYSGAGYAGGSLMVESDFADLDDVVGPCGGDWDDCISSLRVFPP
jgi:hypothetical protein